MGLKKLTPQDIDWMVAKREANKSIEWIAGKLGVGRGTVTYHLQKEGVVPPKGLRPRMKGKPPRGRQTTDKDRKLWAEMAVKGMTPYQIHKVTGRPANTISYWLRRMALEDAAAEQAQESQCGEISRHSLAQHSSCENANAA